MAQDGLKQSWATSLTEVSSTLKEELGSHRHQGGKWYKYMQYVEGTAATDGVAGEVAYYYEDSGHTDNKVTSDVSDCTGEIGAGVLQATMSDLEYGWFQIKGNATLSIALTAGADGDSLTGTGAGDGTLDVATAAHTDHICAQAEDATAKLIICDFPW